MSSRTLSLSSLRTVALSERQKGCDERDFGAAYHRGNSLSDFLCSLPNMGVVADLFALRDAIVLAHKHQRSVILGCDEHVLSAGLGPLLVHLIEQKIITSVALTGSALLQDVEIACSGYTVRYQDKNLLDGRFGLTEETGKLIHEAINFGAIENMGIGQSVGQHLINAELKHLHHSVLATACRYGVPVTVHPAIGADMFSLHPLAHGESLGATAMQDFRLLAGMMAEASDGVLINAASSALLSDAFLQALNMARNLGEEIENITVATTHASLEIQTRHDVMRQLSKKNGHDYCLQAPNEVLLPLLFAAVIDALGGGLD